MVDRLLILWVCLLVALPGSAFGHLSPKTRVGEFSENASIFTSSQSSQLVETQQETPGIGYDVASGMHKYLYGQDNAVSRIGVNP